MWGWRTISPNAPFADGVAYNTSNNTKVIVLMTDGQNTWFDAANALNGSDYSAYGYYKSATAGCRPRIRMFQRRHRRERPWMNWSGRRVLRRVRKGHHDLYDCLLGQQRPHG